MFRQPEAQSAPNGRSPASALYMRNLTNAVYDRYPAESLTFIAQQGYTTARQYDVHAEPLKLLFQGVVALHAFGTGNRTPLCRMVGYIQRVSENEP